MQVVPASFHTASYESTSWVEVWRGAEQLGIGEFADGGVTATWVTSGPRRTLSLQVAPDRDWLNWLRIGVELRPYRGIRYTDGDVILPLGRFPVRKFTRPRSPSMLTVNAQDRWQWVSSANFGRVINAYTGRSVIIAGRLLAEVDPYGWGQVLDVSATSGVMVPAGTWSGTRSDTVADLVEPAGAEALVNRVGDPVVQDRPGVTAPVVSIRAGVDGTLIDLVEEIDWEKVANMVVVSCSATGTTLQPIQVGISDMADPAHRLNIAGGTRSGGWQVLPYSSAAFTTTGQMAAAGRALLAKNAAPARQWSVQMPPDVSLDESDTVLLETRDGDVTAQIQSITYPLSADTASVLTCVSTRDLG